jgi:hypothetical protein
MWHPVVGVELARQRRERLLREARRVSRSRRGPSGGWRQMVGLALLAAGHRVLGRTLEVG